MRKLVEIKHGGISYRVGKQVGRGFAVGDPKAGQDVRVKSLGCTDRIAEVLFEDGSGIQFLGGVTLCWVFEKE